MERPRHFIPLFSKSRSMHPHPRKALFSFLENHFPGGRERTGEEILPFEHIRAHSNSFRAIRTHSNPFKHIRTHSNPFGPIRTHSDPFRAIQTHLDPFKHIWTHSNPFESIRTHSDPFEHVRTHSNTLEHCRIRRNRVNIGVMDRRQKGIIFTLFSNGISLFNDALNGKWGNGRSARSFSGGGKKGGCPGKLRIPSLSCRVS